MGNQKYEDLRDSRDCLASIARRLVCPSVSLAVYNGFLHLMQAHKPSGALRGYGIEQLHAQEVVSGLAQPHEWAVSSTLA